MFFKALLNGTYANFSPLYGMCYSFNFRGIHSSKPPRQTAFNGPFYGLALEIDIEGGYYLRNGLSESEGVAVTIHYPKDIPVTSSSPYNIKPNTLSSIAIMGKEIHRQGPGYNTNCSSSWERSNVYDLHDDDIR